jgi:integrase
MRPGGGMDPAKLVFADMNAVVDTFRVLPKLDGGAMSSKQRGALLSFFFKILDYNRAAGHLDGMSASFARHSSHVIKAEEVDEDDVGKALPQSVIAQLDEQADLLGQGLTHGKMTPEQVQAMARAVYELLRDTGRRPYEIAELRKDCLEYADGEWLLIWDNRKGRRLNRRLEIEHRTVETIRTWLAVRDSLDLPTGSEKGSCSRRPVRTARSGTWGPSRSRQSSASGRTASPSCCPRSSTTTATGCRSTARWSTRTPSVTRSASGTRTPGSGSRYCVSSWTTNPCKPLSGTTGSVTSGSGRRST